jgi:hypothetical protein
MAVLIGRNRHLTGAELCAVAFDASPGLAEAYEKNEPRWQQGVTE